MRNTDGDAAILRRTPPVSRRRRGDQLPIRTAVNLVIGGGLDPTPFSATL